MRKLLVLCGIVTTSGTAAAQGAPIQRQQPVPAPPALSERVRPIPPKPAAAPVVPPLDLDGLLSITLGPPPRAEQEQVLVALIQDTPDSEVEEKSDYYFRLGEVYSAQQRHWARQAAEKSLAIAAATNQQQKVILTRDAAIAASKAKDYLLKTVKVYKGLTDNDAFRNYPRLDKALFSYGYALQTGKYMKEARSVYDKLLKNFPQSAYVPEAHLVFAEYYFEQGQLADAEARYQSVLKFPKAGVYAYAMYKVGWIHLNLQRSVEALEAFFRAAQLTPDAKQAPLHRAAMDGFVTAYAETGKADKARAAFMRVDAARATDMLGVLADRYLAQGKHDGAIYMYREMMKDAPASKDVCKWQYNVAHAMLSTGTLADRVREIENLVALHKALARTKTLPQAETVDCEANAAALSGEIARLWHSEFATTRNAETLQYAERLYKVYVESFPDAQDVGDARAAYAEVLWSRATLEPLPRLQPDRWNAAAEAFMTAASVVRDPQRAADVAAAGVLAWQNGLGGAKIADAVDLEAAARAKPNPKPIPARDAKVLAAVESSARLLTDRQAIVHTTLLAASLYRRYGHPEQALPLLVEIVEHHRDYANIELVANLLLDSLVRAREFEVLLEWVDEFAGDAAFMAGKIELQKNLKLLRSRSLRRR